MDAKTESWGQLGCHLQLPKKTGRLIFHSFISFFLFLLFPPSFAFHAYSFQFSRPSLSSPFPFLPSSLLIPIPVLAPPPFRSFFFLSYCIDKTASWNLFAYICSDRAITGQYCSVCPPWCHISSVDLRWPWVPLKVTSLMCIENLLSTVVYSINWLKDSVHLYRPNTEFGKHSLKYKAAKFYYLRKLGLILVTLWDTINQFWETTYLTLNNN